MKGDRVLYDGKPGEIEFVVDPDRDPEDWYVTEFGGGVMLVVPNVYGRIFMTHTQDEEDLGFVSRG